MNTIREQLKPFVATNKKVRLTRSIDEETINGFVMAIGPRWVLVHQFHDFIPDGYTAIRIDDITKVRSGEYERLWERMLAAEGALNGLAAPLDVSLKSLSRLLSDLQQRGRNVIVNCELDEDGNRDEGGYYIGRILSVDSASMRFANFTALAQWDEEPDTILLESITRIEIEAHYVQTFSKYVEGPCPHLG